MNDRNRNDIHTGDRVRLEHTLERGTVLTEDGPDPDHYITVKMDRSAVPIKLRRRMFVPVVDRKSKL